MEVASYTDFCFPSKKGLLQTAKVRMTLTAIFTSPNSNISYAAAAHLGGLVLNGFRIQAQEAAIDSHVLLPRWTHMT